ncbi:MAG TPA: M48 family metalloprotease [Nitrolancea sp.]|nr:M48 family metalloprotease [Nitrolancea sp.]
MHSDMQQFTPCRSVPGPQDRKSFFEEQQRNRRATWRLTAVCWAIILAMGLVMSAILTPAVLGELSLLFGIAGIFLPVDWLRDIFIGGYAAVVENVGAGTAHPVRFAFGLFLLVGPGMLITFFLWRWLHSIFVRFGVGGVLLSLGAREPKLDDIEEQQLVNIVAEMAIADGIAPPRVMLLDSRASNAAMIGASPETATMVVSRRMLDDLDRDETQGVLGQLIGAAGNGDLGIALKIASVFQTYGLLMTILMLPMSQNARRAFWNLLKLSLASGTDGAAKAELTNQLLLRASTPDGLEDLGRFMEFDSEKYSNLKKVLLFIRVAIFFPLVLGVLFAYIVLLMVVLFLLGPLLAFTWRTRVYLADATSVQLTRNPDGLGRALEQLLQTGALIPGSQMVSHLFIVGAEAAGGRRLNRMQQQLTQLGQQRRNTEGLSNKVDVSKQMMAMLMTEQLAREQEEADTFEDKQGIVVSFHPSLNRRLMKLRALGAHV